MPPSGCYFSRDNKNYRLSGLENNRSSGLPPDRGLHSLSLDTQAVAVDLLLLSLSFSSFLVFFALPLDAHTTSLSLSFPPCPISSSSLSLPFCPSSPSSSLPSRGQVPHTTPPLFSSLLPPSQHLRGRLPGSPLSTRLQTLSTCSSRLHRTRPLQPAVHYHFTYYTL